MNDDCFPQAIPGSRRVHLRVLPSDPTPVTWPVRRRLTASITAQPRTEHWAVKGIGHDGRSLTLVESVPEGTPLQLGAFRAIVSAVCRVSA